MLLANTNLENRIRATPKTKGTCPHCKEPVISKCGSINIWHWAHKTKCPYETEPMTQWHIDWQELALKNGCDIEVNMDKRIADATNSNYDIFEFQHSPISSEELKSRCEYYKGLGLKINWIFDLRYAYENIKFKTDINDNGVNDIIYFTWNKCKSSLLSLYTQSNYVLLNTSIPYTRRFRYKDVPNYGDIYFDIGVKKYTSYNKVECPSHKIEHCRILTPNHIFKIESGLWSGTGTFVLKEDIFK